MEQTLRNKILDNFAIEFINSHFDDIDLSKVKWEVKTKKQAIKQIKEKDYMSSWVITEVMRWGCKTDFIEKYEVENEEELFVIKIGDNYFGSSEENIG